MVCWFNSDGCRVCCVRRSTAAMQIVSHCGTEPGNARRRVWQRQSYTCRHSLPSPGESDCHGPGVGRVEDFP